MACHLSSSELKVRVDILERLDSVASIACIIKGNIEKIFVLFLILICSGLMKLYP